MPFLMVKAAVTGRASDLAVLCDRYYDGIPSGQNSYL